VAGSSPVASSAPSTPVRTSPEPAVAGQDERAGFTSTRPSGAATMVVLPLSSSTASNRPAASRAARLVARPWITALSPDAPPEAAEAVEDVREMVGPDMLIGLSTHAAGEIDAVDAELVDYIGVGPVHATPTKPGRPAVGPELVRHAAAHAAVPFFAIGGLDEANITEVVAAGASRACVLRAISDAEDPERAARALRDALDAGPPER